ncbi:MAG: hypothetical protein K5851_00655 [Lachnospiraceae bacterium]|nr:hypothetical protein [Lachnospiraceae bacterium]
MSSQYYGNNSNEDRERDFVVSDMSKVERPSLFGANPIGEWKRKRPKKSEPIDMTYASSGDEPIQLTKEERRWYMLGVLKASLLIGLAYAGGLTLVIILLLFLMK